MCTAWPRSNRHERCACMRHGKAAREATSGIEGPNHRPALRGVGGDGERHDNLSHMQSPPTSSLFLLCLRLIASCLPPLLLGLQAAASAGEVRASGLGFGATRGTLIAANLRKEGWGSR